MSSLLKNSLVNVMYLLIRCYNTRFVHWNTNNTDRNGAYKQNPHTHARTHQTLSERKHWKVLVNMKISDTPFFIFWKQSHRSYQPLQIYRKKNVLPPPVPPYNGGGGMQLCFSFFKLKKRYSLIEKLLYKKQIILAA